MTLDYFRPCLVEFSCRPKRASSRLALPSTNKSITNLYSQHILLCSSVDRQSKAGRQACLFDRLAVPAFEVSAKEWRTIKTPSPPKVFSRISSTKRPFQQLSSGPGNLSNQLFLLWTLPASPDNLRPTYRCHRARVSMPSATICVLKKCAYP
jgi:hypothetical protein